MIFIYMFAALAACGSLCYYLGSANRAPSKSEKAAFADLDSKLTEIFKLRHQLQLQTALASARGSIIEKMKKEAAELLANRRL